MTITHRSLARVAAVASAALLIGACSGSGSSSSSGSGLSRTQIVAQANTICAAADTAGAKINQPVDIYDALNAVNYFTKILPITTTEAEKLERLKPDSDVAADWTAFMTQFKAGQALLVSITKRVIKRDPSGLADMRTKSPVIGQRISAAATKLGATDCAPG